MNIARFSVKTAIASALGLAMISALTPAAYADQPEIGTVENLTSGDTACYVDLVDAAGNASTELADFEICNQNLIGKTVALTYESGNVAAASCQGNPECSKTETVMLITRADILDESSNSQEDSSDYPTVAIVQDMVAGDRACYVDVIDPNGSISTQFADFEICEQDLIDQVVELTYESGNIVAESCNGNIECGLSDTVMLITKAVVLSF